MTSFNSVVLKKLLLLFLVIAGIYFAKDFLMPLAIGGILATLFLPFCNWMERRKFPKGLAVFVCLLSLMAFVAGLAILLGWEIAELTKDVDLLKQKAVETFNDIQKYIFDHLGVSIAKQKQIIKDEQPSITGLMQGVAGSLMNLFVTFILVMAYVFFLLYYRTHIRKFFIKVTATSQKEEMEKVVNSAAHVSQQYLLGLFKMIVCLWIMYGIGFSILGVKNALFFAVLCGLLEIVPFVGNITGTTLTVLVSALNGASSPMIWGIIFTYGAVQFIQGWFLEPLIVGPQVKINPLFTIIALVMGELLWGIPGIILAIPITAIFKIICDHIEPLKPIGFLIGETGTKRPEKVMIKKIRHLYKK